MAKKKVVKSVKTQTDRINSIVEQINKATKDEGKLTLLTDEYIKEVPATPTNIFSVDRILGIGGFPHGRLVELYGENSCGKSTLCLQAIAAAQKAGGICAYVDIECALDVFYAEKLGVSVKKLMISQPDCGEEALNLVERLAELMGGGDLIIVDSVAALTPRVEVAGEVGDQFMGLQARMMGQAMRKLIGKVSNSGVTVLFINQVRQTMGGSGYGPQTTTPGGKALKFAASVRLEIRRIGSIKKGEEVVGSKTKVKVVKNKVAPPFREADLEMRFGRGFDPMFDLANLAVKEGLIEKTGAWYSYNETKMQGLENVVAMLETSPEVVEYLNKTLRGIFFSKKE